MKLSQHQKFVRRKYFFASILAGAGAYWLGAGAAPVVLPRLKSVMTQPDIALFGYTFSQPELATALGCAAVFLTVFVLIALLWREHHGRHHKTGRGIAMAVAFIVLLALAGYFYLNSAKNTPLLPAKDQIGYKPADREKLERLIHQGAKND